MHVSQIPSKHAVTHEDSGYDEIDVASLSGVLAEDQDPAMLSRFFDFIPWVSLDGFDTGGDAGADVAVESPVVRLTTGGGGANFDAYLWSKEAWIHIVDNGKLLTFEFPLVSLSSVANLNVWLHLSNGPADPPSETAGHIGWKIINADLYASNADGAAQKITDTGVDLSAAGQRTRLKAVLTPGTDCKYYVNDVLKVTHTANLLPAGWGVQLLFHIRTTLAAVKFIYLGRVLIDKEHA